MSIMATEGPTEEPIPAAPVAVTDWRPRYPKRWAQELEALNAIGWCFRTKTKYDGSPIIDVDYPLDTFSIENPGTTPGASGEVVRLTVTFPPEYPWFPPHVYDLARHLGLRRHYNPSTAALCLIEQEDWSVETTVAELLRTQLPKLLSAGRATTTPADGVEVAGPEPVEALLPRLISPVLLAPDEQIPTSVDQGAIVVGYNIASGEQWLGNALVQHILAPGIDIQPCIQHAMPAAKSLGTFGRLFPLTGYGRWIRDPEFDPVATAEQTYDRIKDRLRPLVLEPPPDQEHDELDPDRIEMLLLLIPSERGHRQPAEAFLGLLRTGPTPRRPGVRPCEYVHVQRLGPGVPRTRTPETVRLQDRHVVLVGLGAIGGHVAQDLARAGVGRLDLVDGDQIDVATAARQCAPPIFAGRKKATVLGGRLRLDMPYTQIRSFPLDVGSGELLVDEDTEDGQHRVRRRRHAHQEKLDAALRHADLVIDAAADPTCTRYLAALRQADGKDFLHVAATAGAWGGTVFLTTGGDHACWACLQHHRIDGTVPVPSRRPRRAHHPGRVRHPHLHRHQRRPGHRCPPRHPRRHPPPSANRAARQASSHRRAWPRALRRSPA